VKLINTDGKAFIGPGSEWFWTAVSGLVLAITFLAIYRQLAMARSASAREQLVSLDREWFSERLMRHRLDVLVALRDGADPAHLPDGAMGAIADWWEMIGELARSGDQDRKHLYLGYTVSCQLWWAILAPTIRRLRAERGIPDLIVDFEWLAGLFAEMDRRAGRPTNDVAMLGPLEAVIAQLRERLHVEQSLRTVIIASPEALPAVPPATAAPAEG
jgi:hypothetical protein